MLVTGSAGHLGEALVRALPVLDQLKAGRDPRSPLARNIGTEGYNGVTTGPCAIR